MACGLGISYIGYAMISFGLANAFAAAVTPYITKLIGRFPMILATAVFHCALIVFMLLWKPTDQYYAYSIIVACWGLVDGIWLIQINGEWKFYSKSIAYWCTLCRVIHKTSP